MPKRKPHPSINVLIVDDHPLVRSGLAQLLEEKPDFGKCSFAEDARQAMELLKSSEPDVIVVDISLADIGGLELIKHIKTRRRSAKVLALSGQDEEVYAERALRAGASGYVSKEVEPEVLVEAIQSVLDGHIALSPRMTKRMLDQAVNGRKATPSSQVSALSDRELEVFQLIGDGLSTRQIAKRLFLSVKTIETYRAHLKSKLNLNDSSELLMVAVSWKLKAASNRQAK